MNDGTIKVAELFAGIGGFRLGLEKANNQFSRGPQQCNDNNQRRMWNDTEQSNERQTTFRVVWANEWDKYAAAIYRKNFGEKELVEGDITKIPTDEVPDHDMFVGGFPCQPFSLAGKREGFEDCRGTLFFEIARILKGKRPPLFLLENVDGLRSHDEGRTFETIIRTLDELGYNVEWKVLNSKYFGVPQNRERIFFIGHLRERGKPQIYPVSCDDKAVAEEGECVGTLTGGGHSGGLHSDMTAVVQSANWVSRGFELRKDDNVPMVVADRTRTYADLGRNLESPKPICNTISGVQKDNLIVLNHAPRCGDPTQGGTGLLIKENEAFCVDSTPHMVMQGEQKLIRRLTPNECGYLQGFVKNWAKIGASPTCISLTDLARRKAIKPNFKTKILRTIHVLKWNEVLIADQQQYKCYGNAVTVNVIQELGELILDWVEANPGVLDS